MGGHSPAHRSCREPGSELSVSVMNALSGNDVAATLRKTAAEDTASPTWYKDAIIYQLHVKAFADSNGDGIGDFAGLTSRLDYLQSLGVTTLWLLPFYVSPGFDDGYDIADRKSKRLNSSH